MIDFCTVSCSADASAQHGGDEKIEKYASVSVLVILVMLFGAVWVGFLLN